MSIKQRIFEAEDLVFEDVTIPEWGITEDDGIRIKMLTSYELDAWEESNTVRNGSRHEANRKNMRARYLVRCLVDDKGNRIFTDPDAVALGKKSGAVIDRLWEKAAKLNGVIESQVQDLAKNSASDQSDDSGISSQEPSSTDQ